MEHTHLNTPTFDYAFIGLGASNGLILLKLLDKNLLHKKQVAIFEKTDKNIDDKTYCFWARPNEEITAFLAPIIWRKYENVITNSGEKEDIKTQPYYLVRSIDFYNLVKKRLIDAGIEIIQNEIVGVSKSDKTCCVETPNVKYHAHVVFDSLPTDIKIQNESEVLIYQSFYGFKIRCEAVTFDINTFEMMNFDIDQNLFTQFLYVIPYSDNEALIEITRFGEEKIDKTYATELLQNVIERKYGTFDILGDEAGCIPMTNHTIKSSQIKGHIKTGTNANLVKPSTGYGFKNMFYFANKLAENLEQGINVNEKTAIHQTKFRFWFYDTLLLFILLKWPAKGAEIFKKLFRLNSTKDVFRFLDEKTNGYQELKIFISLPKIIFLKSLLFYLKANHILSRLIYMLAFLAVIVLTYNQIDLGNKLGFALGGLGFILIGLPHGALDYYTIKTNNRVRFIISYVLVILGYFTLWFVMPEFSLILFLLCSAFHFGESELHEIASNTSSLYVIRATLIGCAVLLFIFSTHLSESTQTIADLVNVSFAKKFEYYVGFNNCDIKYYALTYLFSEYIITRKNNFMVLTLLLIAGSFTNLFLSFMGYFICQHSLNSWIFLKQKLNHNSIKLYKMAFPFTLSAMLILGIILINAKYFIQLDKGTQSHFYVFLACVSLPHVLLMSVFIRRNLK